MTIEEAKKKLEEDAFLIDVIYRYIIFGIYTNIIYTHTCEECK